MPHRFWTATLSLVLTLLLINQIGCTSDRAAEQPDLNVEAKFDAPLRQALRQAANSDTTYQVLIELNGEWDDQMREALEGADLRDVKAPGRIATASGSPEAIRRAAALDFVRSMSLSQERPPLN